MQAPVEAQPAPRPPSAETSPGEGCLPGGPAAERRENHCEHLLCARQGGPGSGLTVSVGHQAGQVPHVEHCSPTHAERP